MVASCQMLSWLLRRRAWPGARTVRSPSFIRCTTGLWCGWRRCWCGTRPPPRRAYRTRSWACTGAGRGLRDAEKALAYLRQAVVNRSRSVLRHRTVVDKNLQKAPPDMPSAEHGALVLLERSAVVAALRGLPDRQREAIVLRYYADLSEAEIATAMGISRGAVKSHTARGMTALRTALEQE